MSIPSIINAMEHIDEKLITDSIEYKKNERKNTFLKWGTVAAVFTVLTVASALIIPTFFNDEEVPIIQGTENTDDDSNSENNNSETVKVEDPEVEEPVVEVKEFDLKGRYKDFSVRESVEVGFQWPWEYKLPSEKYTTLTIDGTDYNSQLREISEDCIGENIGIHTVNGIDYINDEKYSIEAEVYTIQHITRDNFLAVKLENNYYVFKNNVYSPPSTLGELLAQVDLAKTVELNRFSENNNSVNPAYYVFEDDDYIWETLSGCKDAPFIEDMFWFPHEREFLSFTVTSESLGVYKVAMYITEDGYLWTNMFSWQYLFEIGEEPARKIIDYARENSSETEYEPYRNSIAGRIVEVADTYMMIDDSELCVDPAEGVAFKVSLDDLCISRYLTVGRVNVGDIVVVEFDGEIDIENGFSIDSAISVSSAIIYDGDVIILE